MKGPETEKSHDRRLRTSFFETYMRGNGLDIGFIGGVEDPEPVLPTAIGIDFDYPGYDGRHLPFADGSQDYVYSSHCLEHIWNPGGAIREWFRVLKAGGFLILVVPHQYLYEKRKRLPSRWNRNHKRFYTPSRLLAETEHALEPNSYRVRMLRDSDFGFDYALGPGAHSTGEYQIELVIEKTLRPAWSLDRGPLKDVLIGPLRTGRVKIRGFLDR